MSGYMCLKNFIKLAAVPFFKDVTQKGSRLRLIGVLVLTISTTAINVWLNLWNRSFYNALEAKQYTEFVNQLGLFTLLASAYILVALTKIKLARDLIIQWRSWITERITTKWLKHRNYYHLELTRGATDNPDQRIAEDVKLCTTQSVEIFLGMFGNLLSLISFVGVLWSISGSLNFTIYGVAITIPGYMIWIALTYSLLGSWLAHKVGHPLNRLNYNFESCEANYRAGLIRIREHAESIALYQGEATEQRHLGGRFQDIKAIWNQLTSCRMKLQGFTAGYGQLAIIFPVLIAAPQYFLTAMTLGTLMQTISAFNRLNDSLSWFIDSYAELSSWRASAERLLKFHLALSDLHQPTPTVCRRVDSGDLLYSTGAVRVHLPCGKLLLAASKIGLKRGQRVLLSGPSGSGKSTLLRVLAGLWPFGQGDIHHPERDVLFLPQRPYLPHGTLRRVLCFPSHSDCFDTTALCQALDLVELSHLATRLEETQNWHMMLSGGEQQRIGLARVFLHKPAWLFLDEATAALDEASESLLFERLQQHLPNCAILTVAHRHYLSRYHHDVWHITKHHEFSELISDEYDPIVFPSNT